MSDPKSEPRTRLAHAVTGLMGLKTRSGAQDERGTDGAACRVEGASTWTSDPACMKAPGAAGHKSGVFIVRACWPSTPQKRRKGFVRVEAGSNHSFDS